MAIRGLCSVKIFLATFSIAVCQASARRCVCLRLQHLQHQDGTTHVPVRSFCNLAAQFDGQLQSFSNGNLRQ
eukprot:CAMPEP_0114681666 /NCGR_PEP_ID=MMETSP0191-20121206/55651_1 /TAXON_ID=126664 /ORGANISM="Sorites sp." /LENGTH=71 /DNA_ID=CAMNT_0001960267 /DNA_START=343 /DNA_END=555 /DNA_ORIENTATION=+